MLPRNSVITAISLDKAVFVDVSSMAPSIELALVGVPTELESQKVRTISPKLFAKLEQSAPPGNWVGLTFSNSPLTQTTQFPSATPQSTAVGADSVPGQSNVQTVPQAETISSIGDPPCDRTR